VISRIVKIRKEIKSLGLDGLFISNQHNVTYLTGFAGLAANEREGFLLITASNAYLLTYATYYGLYQKGESGFQTLSITPTSKLVRHLKELSMSENLKKVGFEKENITVGELSSLKKNLTVTLVETEDIIEKFRLFKDNGELSSITSAAKIGDQAFNFIKTKIKKGKSEKDLAFELEYFIKKQADDISFSPIVAYDEGAAIPHYLPSKKKIITGNTLILLDFGAIVGGYCSDMTRVVFLGTPSETQAKAYKTLLEAHKLLHSELASNSPISGAKLDQIARGVVKKSGFPTYPHSLGHGVGLAIHENPRLRFDKNQLLEPGMVFTLEPAIYIDRKFGIRIEDLVYLKGGNIEILTKSSKDLTILY